MAKSKVWPAPPSVASFKLHLVVHGIDRLPENKPEDCQSSGFAVQIEWRGSGRKSGFRPTGYPRNCTLRQRIRSDGSVSWNEGFDQTCKLKRVNPDGYRGWIISLEIQKFTENHKGKLPTVAKATIDVSEFAQQENGKRIRIPIKCHIKELTADAMLTVQLQFTELKTGSSTALALPRARSLRNFPCTGFSQTSSFRSQNPIAAHESDHQGTYRPTEPSSEDDSDFLPVSQFAGRLDAIKDEKQQPSSRSKKQPFLHRLLSWNQTRQSTKSADHCRPPPLLNRASSEGVGDDIDDRQCRQPIIQLSAPSQQTKLPQPSGFEDTGHWEKKAVVLSRDGQMELVTDIFLASIDQRSEKAGGGNACTVLAAVIADWLHSHPRTLPSRRQFDELVHEGSSEWRKLCADEDHRDKFSDHHFDLDTVLGAKVRPLSVVTEKSYIGFFSPSEMTDGFEFLEGAMSFDSVWDELLCVDGPEERVYIASWNDHFFVLKAEGDAIHLIDTLGERLHEGCRRAYILRFDKESAVLGRSREVKPDGGVDESHGSSHRQVVCEGMASCKEYIKGFLAGLPLRELRRDIERGLIQKVPLDRRLQIEFHYTAPCDVRAEATQQIDNTR